MKRQKDKKTKRRKDKQTKRQKDKKKLKDKKDKQDKRDKRQRPKRDFNIVTSGQFCTPAMFYGMLAHPLYIVYSTV